MLTAIKPKSRTINKIYKEKDVVFLISEFEKIRIQVKDQNIIRVTATRRDSFSDKERPGVINGETSDDYELKDDTGEVIISTKALSVKVDKKSGAISYYNNKGTLLLGEKSDAPRNYEEFETYTLADGEQRTRIIDTADGKKEVIEEPLKIPTGKSYHIRLNLEFGDEALYGFGQHEKEIGSLRGSRLYIHQANRQIAMPVFVSTKGYGMLIDTYSPLIFNDDQNGSYVYTEADCELDYYFMAGGMTQVIKDYRFLAGKAALLPKWAFGYVQSQERYETQTEILETTKKSRDLGIGMDCIVLDWISWGENMWGQKSYDESRFPDPKHMIDELHDEHTHFMISIWPTMAGGTPDNKEFSEKKLFLPACNVYNAFKEEGRKLYFDQLKRTHFAYGTDAWWCDSSEPFTPEWNHMERPEPAKLFGEYCSEAGLRMPYEYCNSFPLYHAMGIYENQRAAMQEMKETPGTAERTEKRVCNLTRSAYTGQQRFGTIMWSGDTDASWETLRAQVTAGLHFCASGIPFWTMDIGAFFVKQGAFWYWDGKYDDTVDDEKYCELFVRWYQLGAFLPVFRGHGTDFRRELWNFKGKYYDALLKTNRLRYRLLPYIYSEAGKVWLEDKSLIRWLAFDFAEDRKVWDIKDQYMFGEALMVCPVLEPMKTERIVYFPKGCDWYDLYTGKKYEDGTIVSVKADPDTIPVFVKSGSIIPMCEPALSTEELGNVEFKKFGDGECRYMYYTDAGDGYGYENGEYFLKEIVLK
ncbi:MAG: DUF4968 domain-containing protein [Lachnospiraceae bacterium]|nr:DUF4968 domain-containing protein [Lachnospiraceae bacterium]